MINSIATKHLKTIISIIYILNKVLGNSIEPNKNIDYSLVKKILIISQIG